MNSVSPLASADVMGGILVFANSHPHIHILLRLVCRWQQEYGVVSAAINMTGDFVVWPDSVHSIISSASTLHKSSFTARGTVACTR